MADSPFQQLAENAALLLAVVFIFDVVALRWRIGHVSLRQAPVGLLLGAIGIAVMLTPWQFTPGIVFDTRSVLLGIAGLFFGIEVKAARRAPFQAAGQARKPTSRVTFTAVPFLAPRPPQWQWR